MNPNKNKVTYTSGKNDNFNLKSGLNFIQSTVSKVVGIKKESESSAYKDKDEGAVDLGTLGGEDLYGYEQLDGNNREENRNVSLGQSSSKNLWTRDGRKTVDE